MKRSLASSAVQSNRPLLDMDETVDFIRSSRSSVYRLVKRGEIRPVKLGGRTLFRRADLEALIDRSVVA